MKNKIIIVIISVSLLAGCWFLCNQRKYSEEILSLPEVVNPYRDADIKAVIIPAENNTFGYDIFVNGAVLVHQPSRPGLPGNTGFVTEVDAMEVAKLVVKKIRNNEMPPTVTIEELRELGVL